MEKRLHANFLAEKQNKRAPVVFRQLEEPVLPDVFVVRHDKEELVSDPLPPPPRILRTPARFRDAGVKESGGTGPNSRTRSGSSGANTRSGASNGSLTSVPKSRKSGRRRGTRSVTAIVYDDPADALPMVLGNLTVESLGRIVHDGDNYHSERLLFPLGYRVRRQYVSPLNPMRKTMYTCEILAGEIGPLFSVTAADDSARPVVMDSPTRCWTEIVSRVNIQRVARKQKPVYTAISGPEYFGLSKPRVQSLIEQLPNAHLCRGYQFRHFNPTTRCVLDEDGNDVVQRRRVGPPAPASSVLGRPRKYPKSSYIAKKEAAAKAAARAAREAASMEQGEQELEDDDQEQLESDTTSKNPTKKRRKTSDKKEDYGDNVAADEVVPKRRNCGECRTSRGSLSPCADCGLHYHAGCVSLSTSPMPEPELVHVWRCPKCLLRRQVNSPPSVPTKARAKPNPSKSKRRRR